VVPQQVEPSPIGSQPIAALPSSLEVERTLAQSANNFTLQLIVLSTQLSVSNVLKKYPAMEPDIRVAKTLVKGKEKFVLEYGSYSDADSANKARQSLPFEFHNALVRKIVR
jgi:DamX protein